MIPRRLVVALALAAAGCGAQQADSGGDAGLQDAAEDGILALRPGWNVMEPGGDTVCSRGAPFRYFVRRGAVNKLLIDLRGGGACWSDATCSMAKSLFQEEATEDPWVTDEGRATGIYDHARPDNPFRDWHHVYIPYCTGDIHWGDNVMTYGSGEGAFTIRHKGAVNARAALDWTFENVRAPEQVMVTGCSAGAYGSILWSAHVRERYPGARVVQLADSGAGVITDTFFQDSYPSWNTLGSYPTWIPGVRPENLTRLPQLYEAIGRHYPDMLLSQYNTAYDEDQSFFFSLMGGGDAREWSRRMRRNVREIAENTTNFTAYLPGGSQHCILGRDSFYTLETDGVKLVDWVRRMLGGERPPVVACEGAECGAPLNQTSSTSRNPRFENCADGG